MARMQSELNAVRGGHGQPAQQHHPPAQPPPAIGHGPSTLFGGIMAGNAAPGGPALAPPPQEGPPPALPPHVPQGQSQALNPPPGPPQAPPYVGYQPGPNGNGAYMMTSYHEGGVETWQFTRTAIDRPIGFAPQPTASPSNKRGGGRAPPGPATPQQQNAVVPYPGSPQVRAPANGHSEPGLVNGQALAQRNTLADLDLDDVSPEYKKEGDDWFVVYNPTVRRELDVELVQSLSHTSVVCCVRFSLDGRLVATGCNRSAQIFNVDYGNVVSVLNDTNVPEEGDLYIRSVCFSPNGLFLATGAEDKVIRVRLAGVLGRPTLTHPGVGHSSADDQAQVHRARARHLLAGLRAQRHHDRVGERRPHRALLGSHDERTGASIFHRGRCDHGGHFARQSLRRGWFVGPEHSGVGLAPARHADLAARGRVRPQGQRVFRRLHADGRPAGQRQPRPHHQDVGPDAAVDATQHCLEREVHPHLRGPQGTACLASAGAHGAADEHRTLSSAWH